MKQALPWNVTGIPPEARELARAAAQREGVSVGDWLTRRILGESGHAAPPAETAKDVPQPAFRAERQAETRPDRDDLAVRRDDLAVKIARSEAESDTAIAHIDEALQAMARRLEMHERARDEAHRVMSTAANEINAATRDQAQAFQHLTQRIDRVERHADAGALRDAVRGLHQGLSRLADQIAKTASESTGQITTLANNVEVLSEKIATARDESKHLGQFLDERLADLNERVKQNEERVNPSSEFAERLKLAEDRIAEEVAKIASDSTHGVEALSGKIESQLASLSERLQQNEERAVSSSDVVEWLRRAEDRLVKEIARTVKASSGEMAAISNDVETLSGKIATLRDDAKDHGLALEEQLAALTERVKQNEESAVSSSELVEQLKQAEGRLAKEIAKTVKEAAGEITTIGGDVEGLSEKIAALRDEAKQRGQTVEGQLAALSQRVWQAEERLALSAPLEDRLTQVETQLASVRSDESVGRLQAHVNSAEERMQEALGRHLAAIERNLDQIGSRLDRYENRNEADDAIHDALRALGARFDAAEATNRDAFTALTASLAETGKRLDGMEAGVATATPHSPPPPPAEDPSSLDLPPFLDAPPFASATYSSGEEPLPPHPEVKADAPLIPEPPPIHSSAENYLAQARRAARAVADTDVEKGRRPRTRVPSEERERGRTRRQDERKASQRLSRPVAVAAAIAVVLAGGFLLSRYSGTPQGPTIATGAETAETPSASSPGSDTAAKNRLADEAPASFGTPPVAIESAPSVAPPAPPPAPPAPAAQRPANPSRVATVTPPRHPPPARTPGASAGDAGASTGPLAALTAQANGGDVKAALALGLKYADGDGVTANDTEAARWLQKAAEGNEPVAQYRLGTFYEKGRGVRTDSRQAMRWYGEAAQRGNRKAMHNLAVAYADGAGTDRNFTEAARWFKAAADLGLTDSQFNLAVLYERGMGVQTSLPEAYKWYAIAAGSGDVEAKARIEALTSQIQPAERDAADKAVQTYKPQAMNPAANDE